MVHGTDRTERHALADRSDSLLVVIDVQEKLMPVITGGEGVVENIRRLLLFARVVGLPAIVTEQEKLGSTLSEIATCIPPVQPVQKLTFNCFGTERFAREVEATGRKTLILTGAEAHICVAQTALHALPRFRVHVIQDAIGSRSLHNRDIALARMQAAGAVITSTEMFIYEILAKAGTDEFKAVLPLVK